jgi:hypothetical protein
MPQAWELRPNGVGQQQQEVDAVAVHEVGRMDPRTQHQPCGVDEQMPRAAFALLAPVVATPAAPVRRFDGLAREAARPGRGITAQPHAQPHAQRGREPFRSQVPARRHFRQSC